MKKNSTYQHLPLLFLILLISFVNNKATAQLNSLSEGFDDVVPAGWESINHSTGNKNGQSWYQGDVRKFNSYSGAANSYAAADYQSVGGSGKGTINNWLITPELNLTNGGAISFFTRTISGSLYPDRLEVRLSTNGASINVGSGTEGTGDFSTVLLTINPTLEINGYPDTGWTKYTVSLSGITEPSSGRIAFRYYVTDAGSGGSNSNYIGVDEFSYESVLPVTLLNFNGEIKNNKALLSWSTANEINNKGFEVQVSHDNKTFSSIGFVTATSNSTGIQQYNFTDDKILSGSNYYRLKQIDIDGNASYSSVVKLDFKKFAWTIFGNPSVNNAYIQLQTETQSNVAVQVISINGQLIQTINKGNLSAGVYNIPLNLENASHGIYVARLIVDNNVYAKKLVR